MKFAAILPALALILALLAGCRSVGNPAATATSGAPSQAVVKAQTITPADGWIEDDFYYNLYYYKDTENSIKLYDQNTSDYKEKFKTVEEFAAYQIKAVTSDEKDPQTSPILRTTVGGMDAAEYTYMTENAKFRMVDILQYPIAYHIQCCAAKADFDKLNSDFQSMIDSYKLTDEEPHYIKIRRNDQ